MTIPTSCTGSLPTFRYAATSGKVGKGRLCEWLFASVVQESYLVD